MGLPSAPYALGEGTLTEQERLIARASSLEPHARWMLDRIAINSRSRAVDFGCGPIEIIIFCLSVSVRMESSLE